MTSTPMIGHFYSDLPIARAGLFDMLSSHAANGGHADGSRRLLYHWQDGGVPEFTMLYGGCWVSTSSMGMFCDNDLLLSINPIPYSTDLGSVH